MCPRFLATIITVLVRRRYAADTLFGPGRPGGATLRAASIGAGLYLAFLALTGWPMSQELGGGGTLQFGAGPMLRFCLLLPLLGAVFTLLAALGTARIWHEGLGSGRQRLKLVVLTSSSSPSYPSWPVGICSALPLLSGARLQQLAAWPSCYSAVAS